jgi:diadenosine tetraphosphatase ApaH/serine/threonine PP2A family protein phosphatase
VVEDARVAGAEQFVLGGDYALAGAWPAETVKALAKLDAQWIRGNTERWLEEPSDAPDDELLHRALEYCRGELGNELTEALFRLPERIEIDGACVCHASPHSDVLTFMPEPTGADHELLSHSNAEVVVFGHSHLQFSREAEGGRLLMNPGSVGAPFDGDRRAAYALWRGGRDFELRRVPYDSDGYAAQVRERMGPALGETVEILVRRIQQAAMVT